MIVTEPQILIPEILMPTVLIVYTNILIYIQCDEYLLQLIREHVDSQDSKSLRP